MRHQHIKKGATLTTYRCIGDYAAGRIVKIQARFVEIKLGQALVRTYRKLGVPGLPRAVIKNYNARLGDRPRHLNFGLSKALGHLVRVEGLHLVLEAFTLRSNLIDRVHLVGNEHKATLHDG